MSESITLTRDQLDEYTRRVVEATYDDLRGEKMRSRRAASTRRRQAAKADAILSRLDSWSLEVLEFVWMELIRERLTASEIVRRADRRQATIDRHRAAAHERSMARLLSSGDPLDAFVAQNAPPLSDRTAERVAALLGGRPAGRINEECESIRSLLAVLGEDLR